MKRTLAIALSTLALTATAVQAQSLPQPSFVDYVPLTAADSSSRGTTSATARQDMPQPSFIDYVAIEPGDASTGSSAGSARSMSVASQRLPEPSFVDYPQDTRTSPLHARQENLHAGSR